MNLASVHNGVDPGGMSGPGLEHPRSSSFPVSGRPFKKSGDRQLPKKTGYRASFELRPVFYAPIAELKRSNKLLMDETQAPVLDPVLGPALAGLIDRAFMRRDKLGELLVLRNDSKGSVRVGAKRRFTAR
jgi:hypothetical protein